jgi:hypothetical protein
MKSIKRNNAVGVKGKSGRKGFAIEEMKKAVLDKAWHVVNLFLGDETISNREKLQVAVEIVKKTIPQEVKGDLNGNFVITWQKE